MASVVSKSHQSFLRGHVLQVSTMCAPHPWSFSAFMKRMGIVGSAHPGRCSRSPGERGEADARGNPA